MNVYGQIDYVKAINLQERVKIYVQEQNNIWNIPTIRELSRRFKINHKEMLQLIEDVEDLHYNIGIQIQGFGTHEYKRIGDYTVEYYE